MATAAARHHKSGDAVAYAATLERWRQEVFAGAVRRRIHDDQGVHLHAARRAAADAIRTAALCERRWRAAQAHAAAAERAARERGTFGEGAARRDPRLSKRVRRDAARRRTARNHFGKNGVALGRARGAPAEGVRPRRVRGGIGKAARGPRAQREGGSRGREAALAARAARRGDESLGRGWRGGDGAATGCVGRPAAGGRGPHARHLPGLGRGRDGLRARGGAAEGVAGRRPPRPVDAELLRPGRVGRLFGRARPPPDGAPLEALGRQRLCK